LKGIEIAGFKSCRAFLLTESLLSLNIEL